MSLQMYWYWFVSELNLLYATLCATIVSAEVIEAAIMKAVGGSNILWVITSEKTWRQFALQRLPPAQSDKL